MRLACLGVAGTSALVVVVGCSLLTPLDDLDRTGGDASAADAPAGGDGPTDAGAKGFCAQQAPGYLFCDDFDTLGDGAAGLNGAWTITNTGLGYVTRVNSRFHSPDYALETAIGAGNSFHSVTRDPGAGPATKATLSLAIYIDPACVEGTTGVGLPSVAGTTYFLTLMMLGPTVAFAEGTLPFTDSGAPTLTQGTTTWPLGRWVRVVLDVDFPSKKAALSLDDTYVETPVLKIANPAGLTRPQVGLGTAVLARTKPCTVDYDDVVFRIN